MRQGPIPSALLAFAASLAACAGDPPRRHAPDIGIGGGETDPHTHLFFEGIPPGAKIVRVSTHLVVDRVAPKGLNFFAVQVDFPNGTWAHGGPQFNDGGDEEANWGGLVDRGGGSKDYDETDWRKDLALIDCGEDKPNTVPWKWERNREYILTVERGKRVALPAGINQAHGNVAIPARAMWEWKFTIVPVGGRGEPFSSRLFDSADHVDSFCVWNESGYGSSSGEQHARWSLPAYRVEGSGADMLPGKWGRD